MPHFEVLVVIWHPLALICHQKMQWRNTPDITLYVYDNDFTKKRRSWHIFLRINRRHQGRILHGNICDKMCKNVRSKYAWLKFSLVYYSLGIWVFFFSLKNLMDILHLFQILFWFFLQLFKNYMEILFSLWLFFYY